jgi:hypothetical protein
VWRVAAEIVVLGNNGEGKCKTLIWVLLAPFLFFLLRLLAWIFMYRNGGCYEERRIEGRKEGKKHVGGKRILTIRGKIMVERGRGFSDGSGGL